MFAFTSVLGVIFFEADKGLVTSHNNSSISSSIAYSHRCLFGTFFLQTRPSVVCHFSQENFAVLLVFSTFSIIGVKFAPFR
jgi:hypothetical protein